MTRAPDFVFERFENALARLKAEPKNLWLALRAQHILSARRVIGPQPSRGADFRQAMEERHAFQRQEVAKASRPALVAQLDGGLRTKSPTLLERQDFEKSLAAIDYYGYRDSEVIQKVSDRLIQGERALSADAFRAGLSVLGRAEKSHLGSQLILAEALLSSDESTVRAALISLESLNRGGVLLENDPVLRKKLATHLSLKSVRNLATHSYTGPATELLVVFPESQTTKAACLLARIKQKFRR